MLEYPVYVRISTEGDKPLFRNQSSAEAVIGGVVNAQTQGWLRLHGFVVLPEALEMVMSPIRQGTAGVVAYIQSETILPLAILQPNAGMVWSSRFTEISLTTQRAMDARLNMMLLIPVANGIAESAEAYPYSSANPRYSSCVSLYSGFVKLLPKDEGISEALNAGRAEETG